MTRLRVLLARAAALFSRDRLDRRLGEELEAHLAALAPGHERRGLSPAAARVAALRDFGGVAHLADAYRDQRGLPARESFAQDLRYGVRMVRRAPGFSAVV